MPKNDFQKEISKALEVVTEKQLITISRSSLKTTRKKFQRDIVKYVKSVLGVKRPMAVIKERLKTLLSKPITEGSAVVDRWGISRPQFSFLAFKVKTGVKPLPKKKRGVDRRLSGKPRQRVLKQVQVAGNFKAYKGVFIGIGNNNNKLPFRRVDQSNPRSRIESMQVNVFNMLTLNEKRFKDSTKEYVNVLQAKLSEKILKKATKNIEKSKPKLNIEIG